ncbi:hypothetical protein, partial [Lysinibacillus sphaericus]|uniref:hypothetical protein n=1 Tax=Lysinibacillus sphaericus TaxID=1421 RepID=UPI00056C9DFF
RFVEAVLVKIVVLFGVYWLLVSYSSNISPFMETSLNNGFALSSFFYTYKPAQKMSKKSTSLSTKQRRCLMLT